MEAPVQITGVKINWYFQRLNLTNGISFLYKIQFVSITIQKANWYLHLLTRKREEREKSIVLIIWAVNVTDTLDRIKKCIPMVRERVMNVCQEWQRNYIIKDGVILSWRTKRMNQLEINSISDWL